MLAELTSLELLKMVGKIELLKMVAENMRVVSAPSLSTKQLTSGL